MSLLMICMPSLRNVHLNPLPILKLIVSCKSKTDLRDSIEAYRVLAYVEQITSPSSVHATCRQSLCTRTTPEGWDGKGSGRGIWDEGQYNKNREKLDYLFVVELQELFIFSGFKLSMICKYILILNSYVICRQFFPSYKIFTFLIMSFDEQIFLILVRSDLSIFLSFHVFLVLQLRNAVSKSKVMEIYPQSLF